MSPQQRDTVLTICRWVVGSLSVVARTSAPLACHQIRHGEIAGKLQPPLLRHPHYPDAISSLLATIAVGLFWRSRICLAATRPDSR